MRARTMATGPTTLILVVRTSRKTTMAASVLSHCQMGKAADCSGVDGGLTGLLANFHGSFMNENTGKRILRCHDCDVGAKLTPDGVSRQSLQTTPFRSRTESAERTNRQRQHYVRRRRTVDIRSPTVLHVHVLLLWVPEAHRLVTSLSHQIRIGVPPQHDIVVDLCPHHFQPTEDQPTEGQPTIGRRLRPSADLDASEESPKYTRDFHQ